MWIWGKSSPEVRGCPSHHDISGAPNTLTGGVHVTTGGVDFAPLLREVSAVSPLPSCCLSRPYSVHYFLFLFFWMWAIFKVFIEFVKILFLFLRFGFFWPGGMWDLSFLTRDQTCVPFIGR